MRDALTFSVVWTMGVGVVVGVPLTLVLLYGILRGGEQAGERRSRELYRLLLEEELHGDRCFACRADVEPDWLRCPACTEELRGRCGTCDAIVRLHWSACPCCASALERLPEPLAAAA